MNWINPDWDWPVWFTADTHLQHLKISDYVTRPFASLAEMDAYLIRRWNELVAPTDLVFHLGDFAMGDPRNWANLRRQLNGFIVLVLGNHDRSQAFMRGCGFDQVVRNVVVNVRGVRLWLNHYPVRKPTERGSRRPCAPSAYDIALCGHVHDAWLVQNGVINVGVDRWDYGPATLDQITQVKESLINSP